MAGTAIDQKPTSLLWRISITVLSTLAVAGLAGALRAVQWHGAIAEAIAAYRGVVHTAWDLIFFWLPIVLPDGLKDYLTFGVLYFLKILSLLDRERRREDRMSLVVLFLGGLTIWPVLILLSIRSAFSSDPHTAAQFRGVLQWLLVVGGLVGVLFVLNETGLAIG